MNSPEREKFVRERALLHDVINELSVMKMAMFLGKKKIEDAQAVKYITDTEDSIKRIEKLIQEYRDEHSL